MSYNLNPNLRRASQDKQAQEKKSPFKLFCKETLAKYNSGLISADEYYKCISDAKLLLV